MQTVRHNVIYDLIDYETLIFERAVLKNVRYHIVSEFVHRQFSYHAHDLVSDELDLISREPLHDPLYNAAPVFIFAKLDDLDLG